MSLEWMPMTQVAAILDCSIRHARRELAGADASQIRHEPQPVGRPRTLYHCSAHPALRSWRERRDAGLKPAAPAPAPAPAAPAALQEVQAKAPARPTSASPDDMALAALRAEAVRAYIALRARLPEREAAHAVRLDFAQNPRRRAVRSEERLPGQYRRLRRAELVLGSFSETTLRLWHAAWLEGGLLALVPCRKGRSGRARSGIPEQLLHIVWAWSVKNPRADLRKGIAEARAEWPGDFPAISYSTWRRRLAERDGGKAVATLGKQGFSAFRARHSPDIERDYSAMAYNEEWQLDDATMDFYGLSWTHERLVRPYAYAIIRVATRQWVAVVATETPIVKDQVKALLGLAMADRRGGVPGRIRFERGAVACDQATQELLESLGITVHRTSMDGGRRHADAFKDRAGGHFQGKGVIERAIRSLHNQPGLWDDPLQVGPAERDTAAQNLETIKALLLAQAKEGRVIPRMQPAQWQAAVARAMQLYNSSPHGSLPEIVDAASPADGPIRYRHMSPDEYAAKLAAEVRVLDQKLLPLFFQRGNLIQVGKNGFTLNGFSYGRFDAELQALAGRRVNAFALPEHPGVAYVAELGRCVEAWQAPAAGQEGHLLDAKRAIEARPRNQYEAMIADALSAGSRAVLDQTRILAGAVPIAARVTTVSAPALADRAATQQTAVDQFIARQRRLDGRFDFAEPRLAKGGARSPSAPSDLDCSAPQRLDASCLDAAAPRRGILARAADYAGQLAALVGDHPAEQSPDKFAIAPLPVETQP